MPTGRSIAAALAALLTLAGCATAPSHPALQSSALPELLPVRRFVANVDAVGGYLLSPDGNRVLWTQTVGLDVGVAVRSVGNDAEVRSFATGWLARPLTAGPIYSWLADSRHVAYIKDFSGDENTQLFVFDSVAAGFEPWAVTPWPGVKSTYVSPGAPGSTRFYFASNRRDRGTFDLYEADAATRSTREIARSDGHVLQWLIGTERQLAGRIRQLGAADGSDRVLELLEPDGQWRSAKTIKGHDQWWVQRIDRRAARLWAVSNIGRDKAALVELNLADDNERVLAEHPVVDVDGTIFPPAQGGPLAYTVEPDRPRIEYLDHDFGAVIASAVKRARAEGLLDRDPVVARPVTMTRDMQRMLLRAVTDYGTTELLFDRRSGALTRLRAPSPEAASSLSPMQPFSFVASDGMTIHGYVVRPRGVTQRVPMVVTIHGGPWVRDEWQPAEFNASRNAAQFLANRGYAVLMVNYRGSSGYGRAYMNAGAQQYSGLLQKDIAEAVSWAIDAGVADPQRIAVMGGSFGGFATLMQLIQQPHRYACGINIVGVANWPRVIENWPPFWRNRHVFEAFYGDVRVPAQREKMLAQSPISQIDRIAAPLLVIHGANDIRVLRQDSDDVVAELRKLGRPVEYLLFDNEGHSIRRWRNRLEMWRRIEDTLAECLGGRSNGFDYYQLMPR
jgi:dipeptidyl aminopeptidase/acylaminoacyl peptidase